MKTMMRSIRINSPFSNNVSILPILFISFTIWLILSYHKEIKNLFSPQKAPYLLITCVLVIIGTIGFTQLRPRPDYEITLNKEMVTGNGSLTLKVRNTGKDPLIVYPRYTIDTGGDGCIVWGIKMNETWPDEYVQLASNEIYYQRIFTDLSNGPYVVTKQIRILRLERTVSERVKFSVYNSSRPWEEPDG